MFNVGDMVYVPNAVEWVWEASPVTIKSISEENDKTVYYADCLHHNLFRNNSDYEHKEKMFFEHEIFQDAKSCRDYISKYYYDGLCSGCKYENKNGNVWTCDDCSHKKIIKSNDPTIFDKYVCEKTGITIGGSYARGSEICSYYNPTLPQNIREFGSWEVYNDVLKNCEFNKNCIHHKNSCHRTCTYEHYMNEYMWIPKHFEINGKMVRSVCIKRKTWVDLSFIDGDVLKCFGLKFEPELTKSGKVKKNSIKGIRFAAEVEAKVNVKTGEIDALATFY